MRGEVADEGPGAGHWQRWEKNPDLAASVQVLLQGFTAPGPKG